MPNIQDILSIRHPFLMAPMFLVSNVEMIKAGIRAGVMATFPSLNYLDDKQLEEDIISLHQYKGKYQGNFGVNLIIKGNRKLESHLEILVRQKVPLVITSLGNPNEVIEKVHQYGGLVFCDITNMEYAQKAEKADGLIAVGNLAGGHSGKESLDILVPQLKTVFPDKIIVAAGGIGNHASYQQALKNGASAVSVGTPFIASKESKVSKAYKEAVIKANKEDIMLSPILSGTPSTIIRTPYVLELEQRLKDEKLSLEKGVALLQKAGHSADYKSIFVAGTSVQYIKEELLVEDIIKNIIQD